MSTSVVNRSHKCAMVQNRKKNRKNSHLINNHLLSYEWGSERSERASEASSVEQANKWAVRANRWMDERVAQYSNLHSWLFWPTVHCSFLSLVPVESSGFSVIMIAKQLIEYGVSFIGPTLVDWNRGDNKRTKLLLRNRVMKKGWWRGIRNEEERKKREVREGKKKKKSRGGNEIRRKKKKTNGKRKAEAKCVKTSWTEFRHKVRSGYLLAYLSWWFF